MGLGLRQRLESKPKRKRSCQLAPDPLLDDLARLRSTSHWVATFSNMSHSGFTGLDVPPYLLDAGTTALNLARDWHVATASAVILPTWGVPSPLRQSFVTNTEIRLSAAKGTTSLHLPRAWVGEQSPLEVKVTGINHLSLLPRSHCAHAAMPTTWSKGLTHGFFLVFDDPIARSRQKCAGSFSNLIRARPRSLPTHIERPVL